MFLTKKSKLDHIFFLFETKKLKKEIVKIIIIKIDR